MVARASAAVTLARPPRNHSDVHGDASLQILQLLEDEDLAGELMDSARALARIESRVGRNAPDDELEFAAPLAAGLRGAARQ